MIRIINGLSLIIITFFITAYMMHVFGDFAGFFIGLFTSLSIIMFFSLVVELLKKIRDKYFW
jgi:hypothetical protein